MKKLRIGVVGSGFIATQKHLPAFLSMRKLADVVAVCDAEHSRGQEVCSRFDIPKAYVDLHEMLEVERLDMVDVCTPPRTHAGIAVDSLKMGVHVLVEKPMALNVSECDEIMEAAQENERQVCVAHSDLFYPSFQKARSLVENGDIGQFRGMRIFLSTPIDYMMSNPDHWAHKLPGGVVGETGPHIVYMTLPFISPIESVNVTARKVLHEYAWSPYDDYRIELTGENATSSVTLLYATNQWAAEVELWGTEGSVKADLESQSLIRYERPNLTAFPVGMSAISQAGQFLGSVVRSGVKVATRRFPGTHGLLIRQFLESIVQGTDSPVTSAEGREAVRVMNMIAQQLQE